MGPLSGRVSGVLGFMTPMAPASATNDPDRAKGPGLLHLAGEPGGESYAEALCELFSIWTRLRSGRARRWRIARRPPPPRSGWPEDQGRAAGAVTLSAGRRVSDRSTQAGGAQAEGQPPSGWGRISGP